MGTPSKTAEQMIYSIFFDYHLFAFKQISTSSPSRIFYNLQKRSLDCYSLNVSNMRFVLAGFLFGLLVLATKADEPVETEYEDPIEELNDLVDWEVEDHHEVKPTSVKVSSLIIVFRIS